MHPALRSARRSSRHRTELGGLAVALVLAVVAVAHLATSDRAWILFYDADSVLPAMVHQSIAAGQPQHWTMSAVLFLPEIALYLVIAAVVRSTQASLALNGVVNIVLLYVAFRFVVHVAAVKASRSVRIGGALLAVSTLVALSLLDSSRSWDSAELPSLSMTTTYYSATLLALVVTPGIVLGAARSTGSRIRPWLAALILVAALSTLTDPLFLGWVVVPLALAVLLVTARALMSRSTAALLLGSLAVGAVLGWVLRIPLSGMVGRDAASYLNPGQSLHVLFGYYLRLTLERMATPDGAVEVVVDLALIAGSVLIYRRGIRRREPAAVLLGALGGLTPVIVLVGAVMSGAAAYRYLQPAYMAPLLALSLLPSLLRPRPGLIPAPARRVGLAAAGVALALVGGVATSEVAVAAATPDPSIRCVDDWITASHRIGAGRFETIRGPKAYLADPRQLVQVTPSFHGYLALANGADFAAKAASFIVSDATTPPPTAPAAAVAPIPTVHACGRYTITDYHRPVLSIGPLTTAYDP